MERAGQRRRDGQAPAPLLTAAEFDRVTDVLADIASARLDTALDDAVAAGETLDRLGRLRHLLVDPPDLRVGWRC